MKAKLYVTKIETPEDIAQSANGKPAYIKLRTRLKKKYIKLMNRGIEAANAVMQLKDDADGNDAAVIDALTRFNAYNDNDRPKVYAYVVTEWNWIDAETGEPLPAPDKVETFDELYPQQLDWIQAQINDVMSFRATEGNGMSGSGS